MKEVTVYRVWLGVIAGRWTEYSLLLYLLVSTRAVIGQFSEPYSPVRTAKI